MAEDETLESKQARQSNQPSEPISFKSKLRSFFAQFDDKEIDTAFWIKFAVGNREQPTDYVEEKPDMSRAKVAIRLFILLGMVGLVYLGYTLLLTMHFWATFGLWLGAAALPVIPNLLYRLVMFMTDEPKPPSRPELFHFIATVRDITDAANAATHAAPELFDYLGKYNPLRADVLKVYFAKAAAEATVVGWKVQSQEALVKRAEAKANVKSLKEKLTNSTTEESQEILAEKIAAEAEVERWTEKSQTLVTGLVNLYKLDTRLAGGLCEKLEQIIEQEKGSKNTPDTSSEPTQPLDLKQVKAAFYTQTQHKGPNSDPKSSLHSSGIGNGDEKQASKEIIKSSTEDNSNGVATTPPLDLNGGKSFASISQKLPRRSSLTEKRDVSTTLTDSTRDDRENNGQNLTPTEKLGSPLIIDTSDVTSTDSSTPPSQSRKTATSVIPSSVSFSFNIAQNSAINSKINTPPPQEAQTNLLKEPPKLLVETS
jgi:hypothetical protein